MKILRSCSLSIGRLSTWKKTRMLRRMTKHTKLSSWTVEPARLSRTWSILTKSQYLHQRRVNLSKRRRDQVAFSKRKKLSITQTKCLEIWIRQRTANEVIQKAKTPPRASKSNGLAGADHATAPTSKSETNLWLTWRTKRFGYALKRSLPLTRPRLFSIGMIQFSVQASSHPTRNSFTTRRFSSQTFLNRN